MDRVQILHALFLLASPMCLVSRLNSSVGAWRMGIIGRLALLATLLAIALQTYIYTYPSLNASQCYWSHEYRGDLTPMQEQLISIPYIGDLYKQYFMVDQGTKPGLELEEGQPRDIRMMTVGDPQLNGNWPSTPYMKRLDNLGNDYYMRHIYQVMKKRLDPTFVTMMGDLLSSQWIGDSEFFNRTRRIVNRSFPRPERQVLTQLEICDKHEDLDWMGYFYEFYDNLNKGFFKDPNFYHFENVYDWDSEGPFLDKETGLNKEPLFLNVTGNHDIGYGDTTFQHMCRWSTLFGKSNYWIEYDNDTSHPWRIVMLNSLAIDGPMLEPVFKDYVWQFIETLERRKYNGSTILLTHVPMYKRTGLCNDGPRFEYYEAEGCHGCSPSRVGLLKSQNHLSEEATQRILNAVFREGKSGIILTGHDHYGCDNYYNYQEETNQWVASKTIDSMKWIREVTVRSIMGDYHGTMGIMTGHFDKNSDAWEFDYSECRFTIQHVWWAAHICTLIALLLTSISIFV